MSRFPDGILAGRIGGLLLLAIGAAFGMGATRYDIGTVTSMGPGFVPLAFGLVLALLGIADIAVSSQQVREEEADPTEWGAAAFVLTSVLAFGLLVGRTGFDPAVFVATVLSMLWERPVRWARILIFSASLTVFADIVFLRLLSLPYRAFGG